MLVVLNAVFAVIFFLIARRAVPRGLLFLRHGWLLVQANAGRPDARDNVESRHAISSGGHFMIGGAIWLGGGLLAAALGLLFAVQAVLFIGAPI